MCSLKVLYFYAASQANRELTMLTSTTTGFFCPLPASSTTCSLRPADAPPPSPSARPSPPSPRWPRLWRRRAESRGKVAGQRLQARGSPREPRGCCRWSPTGVKSTSLSASREVSIASSVSDDRFLSGQVPIN